MGPEGSDTHVTTRVMGTYGYAAPEYVTTGSILFQKQISVCSFPSLFLSMFFIFFFRIYVLLLMNFNMWMNLQGT